MCESCRTLPIARTQTPMGHQVFAIGPYAGRLGECLRRLKYEDETHLAFPLGRALRRVVPPHHDPAAAPRVLVPVPLHPTRLAERGYNQTALLARSLSRYGHSRVVTSCLSRPEARAAQARLSGQERRTNLSGAFVARATRTVPSSSSVFLLDDVVTTGSTIDAAAAALEAIDIHVTGVLACAIASGRGADM